MLWHQDFSFADVICGADQPILFHLLHKPRGFVITNSQFSLDVAGRTFAIFGNDLHGRVIERIFQIRIATETKHRVNITLSRLARTLQNSRKVIWRTEGFEMIDHIFHFFIRTEGAMHTRDFTATGHVKHITHA